VIYTVEQLNSIPEALRDLKNLIGHKVLAGDRVNDLSTIGTLTSIARHESYPFLVEFKDGTSNAYKFVKALSLSETENKTNNKATGGNNMAMTMDIGQIISMKVMTSLIDSDKELDLGKLALVQSLSNGGQFQITDVVKAKILSKLSIDDKTDAENLPIEKLVILKMLEEGRFDIMEIIKARLIAKELKD
jgi:hypothetical protein